MAQGRRDRHCPLLHTKHADQSSERSRLSKGGDPPPPSAICGMRAVSAQETRDCSRGTSGVNIRSCHCPDKEKRVRPGPEGEGGTPQLGRLMGGGVIPFQKKEGGGVGGSPPSPPWRFPGPVCPLVLRFLPGHHMGDLSHGYRHGPGKG